MKTNQALMRAIALPPAGRETFAVIERGWPAGTNAPAERGLILFLSDSGEYACGVWEGDPGTIPLASYPVHEFCTILAGNVTLVATDGTRQTFERGMSFVVPLGFSGAWEMPQGCKKHFAAYGTRAAIARLCGAA